MSNFYKRQPESYYRDHISKATSVVVLRNPWVRAVSAYRQKLSDEKTQGNVLRKIQREILISQRGLPADYKRKRGSESPTFEEFVRHNIQVERIKERHFNKQASFLGKNLQRYDAVIPLEFAGPLSQRLFDSVGKKVKLFAAYDQISDPKLQSSVIKAKEWFSSLDKTLTDKFYELYKFDFLLLNYSNFSDSNFPLPLDYY